MSAAQMQAVLVAVQRSRPSLAEWEEAVRAVKSWGRFPPLAPDQLICVVDHTPALGAPVGCISGSDKFSALHSTPAPTAASMSPTPCNHTPAAPPVLPVRCVPPVEIASSKNEPPRRARRTYHPLAAPVLLLSSLAVALGLSALSNDQSQFLWLWLAVQSGTLLGATAIIGGETRSCVAPPDSEATPTQRKP